MIAASWPWLWPQPFAFLAAAGAGALVALTTLPLYRRWSR